MLGLKILIYSVLLLDSVLIAQIEIDGIYNNGLLAYKKGQYDLSIQEFETILSKNKESPELYYNLGNSYYRMGDISGAIWSYESCLKLMPAHNNAIYNLKLVNLKVVDKLYMPSPPIYLDLYFNIMDWLSFSDWLQLLLLILLLISTLVTIINYYKSPLLKIFQMLFIILFFLLSFITIHSYWNNIYNIKGIIYSNNVEVRSEPNESSTYLFQINEGLKVKIIQERNQWVEIELLDGKTGWVSYDQIRIIN